MTTLIDTHQADPLLGADSVAYAIALRVLRRWELTPVTYRLLETLADRPRTAAELATTLNLTSHETAGLLRQTSIRHYLTHTENRPRVYALTPIGTEIFEAIRWMVTHAASPDPADSAPTTPTIARITAWWRGEHHHLPADRRAAEHLAALCPQAPTAAFWSRSLAFEGIRLAAARHIRQFVVIGSGTAGNHIHQALTAPAHLTYLDPDPSTVSLNDILLAQNPPPLGTVVTSACAPLTAHPLEVLQTTDTDWDITHPVAVIATGVLQWIASTRDAATWIKDWYNAIAPGSLLILDHLRTPHAVKGITPDGTPPLYPRTRKQTTAILADIPVQPPGLVATPRLLPNPRSFTRSDLTCSVAATIAKP